MPPPQKGQEAPPGTSKRQAGTETVKVSRDELRAHNQAKRKKQAETKRSKLLEACQAARREAEKQDEWLDRVQDAPVYRPTAAQWEDPLAYIRSIQGEAAQCGICIVRAPVAPTIPGGLAMQLSDPGLKFGTRQQALRDTPWQSFDGGSVFHPGKRYSMKEFQDAACTAAAKRFGGLHGSLPTRLVEREYWRERSKTAGAAQWIEYGSDLDGSLFLREDALGDTRWNLNVLPCEPGSALRHCGGRPIAGVSVPMLYVGQLFSTFAWHVEDHFMYSVNYQHLGASKTWYGVPASDADALEGVARSTVYAPACAALEAEGADDAQVWCAVERALIGKTTMLSPRLLLDKGVRVYRAVQEVGDFVITFPRAYHAGFGCGFQVGEAVNFTMGDWWLFGEDARQRYRRMRYPSIVPQEQLLCDDALALAKRRAVACSAAGDDDGAAASENALAWAFVGVMRRLHAHRAALERAGAVPLSACSPDSGAVHQSLHCTNCQQSVYVASAVLEPQGPPAAWRHVCFECAARELAAKAAQAGAAKAEAGAKAEAEAEAEQGKEQPSAAAGVLLFVKPCWEELEQCCRELEQGVQDPAATPLTLPLAGTTEAERYGRRDEPAMPSPCEPYAWTALQQLRPDLPSALVRALRPGAAPAAPADDAGPAAAAQLRAAGLSPASVFQAALDQEDAAKQEQEQEQQQQAAGVEGSGAAAGAAAPAQPAKKRSRPSAAAADADDHTGSLPLVADTPVEVQGRAVTRHVHRDEQGVLVLMGSEALEAVLGQARDKKESAPKKLGSWLRKAGGGAVAKAHLAGPGRHQAVALLRREDARALLTWRDFGRERRDLLRAFVKGVWPDVDESAVAAEAAMEKTPEPAPGGSAAPPEDPTPPAPATVPERAPHAAAMLRPTPRRAALGAGRWPEDEPLSDEEEDGGAAAAAAALEAESAAAEGPASKRLRRAGAPALATAVQPAAPMPETTAAAAVPVAAAEPRAAAAMHPASLRAASPLKLEQHGAAPLAAVAPVQQPPVPEAAAQAQQPPVPSAEDMAASVQIMATAGPELLASILEQGMGITDPQSVEVLCQLALAAQGQQQQQRQQVPLPPPGDAMGLQLSAVQQQALAHLVGIEQRGLGGGALAQPSAPASGTAFQPWGYSAPSPQ